MIIHTPKLNLRLNNFFLSNLIMVLFFTFLYNLVNYYESESGKKSSFDKKPVKNYSFFEWFYFSLVTQTTVGYGNNVEKMIPANSKLQRFINMIQMLSIFGLITIHL